MLPKGTILAYATSPGSVAADGSGRNGLYTGALLRNFNKPGVTVKQAFNNTGLEVLEESGSKQIPWMSSTPVQPFYLAGGAMVIERPSVQSRPGEIGSLEVKTDPPGAEISIDGVYEGVSPLKLDLATGIVRITGEKSGYKPESKKLRIRKGRTSNLTLILDSDGPSPAYLYVETVPVGARVRILNISPPYSEGMELEPGNYEIEVSKSGYQKIVRTVVLVAGSSEPLLFKLKKGGGSGRTMTDSVTGMEFVFVKGGCYQMGDTFGDGNDDEKPVHEVCVDSFWMGKYEVTQGQYQKITGSNPSHFKNGSNYPVEKVSWDDAQGFIRQLNSRGNKTFRLPTEAEWEYAARSGGKKQKYAGGNSVDSVAWYGSNSGSQTHRVGTKSPNGLGLNDMTGNVWEWCSDWYGKNYFSSSPRKNPQGASSGSNRVFRGGSWFSSPRIVRAALRDGNGPGLRYDFLGFRLVLSEGSK